MIKFICDTSILNFMVWKFKISDWLKSNTTQPMGFLLLNKNMWQCHSVLFYYIFNNLYFPLNRNYSIYNSSHSHLNHVYLLHYFSKIIDRQDDSLKFLRLRLISFEWFIIYASFLNRFGNKFPFFNRARTN